MKHNTVLLGKALILYYNKYVSIARYNKVYFENANLLWKHASTKNLFWDNKEQL